MRSLRICGFLTLVLLAQSQAKPLASASSAASSIVEADMSVHEWLDNYLEWTHHNPQVIRHEGSSSPPEPLMLGMPYLELFSPAGVSLYRGTNADENAVFLRQLQREIPTHSTIKTNELRPTLKEDIEMVAELKRGEARLLDGKQFTIFAVTYPDRQFCKAQNEAIRGVGGRQNIRIIEVRLHS